VRSVDVNFIHCLVPLLLTLILIRLIFKNRFATNKVLNFIKWVKLSYTIITFIFYIIGLILYPDEYAFINRATGSYWLFYWLMLFSARILPFTLLIDKLGTSYWYVLLISVLMKIGMYFE